jgi:hypothetical protein
MLRGQRMRSFGHSVMRFGFYRWQTKKGPHEVGRTTPSVALTPTTSPASNESAASSTATAPGSRRSTCLSTLRALVVAAPG